MALFYVAVVNKLPMTGKVDHIHLRTSLLATLYFHHSFAV